MRRHYASVVDSVTGGDIYRAWLFPVRIGRVGFCIRLLGVWTLTGILAAVVRGWVNGWLGMTADMGQHFAIWLPISAITVALNWFLIEYVAMPRLSDMGWSRKLAFLLFFVPLALPFVLILGLARTRPVQT